MERVRSPEAALVITIAIWHFSDNALQDWCEKSAFGKDAKNKFTTVDTQQKTFIEALIEVAG